MRLTLVRHGETDKNAKRIIQGQAPGFLNQKGKKQAKALGKLLKKEKFDFIYCSDLKRCKDTLMEISKFHQHVPVVFTKELRERSYGIYEGKSFEIYSKNIKRIKGSRVNHKPAGGESLAELRRRAGKFFTYLKKNHGNDRLLIVTHGGLLRAFASILTKTPILQLLQTVRFHNTSVTEFEITKTGPRTRRYNDIKHL